jgi:hypothetical protein
MCQLEPFHRSTRTLELGVKAFEAPTATHADRDGHATPNRTLCREPAWLGVGWMRHLAPFHRSTKAVSVPDALIVSPTAVHADRDEQSTPLNKLTLAPRGLGVRWIRHVVPFQLSDKLAPSFEDLS